MKMYLIFIQRCFLSIQGVFIRFISVSPDLAGSRSSTHYLIKYDPGYYWFKQNEQHRQVASNDTLTLE